MGESCDLDRVYRPHSVQFALTTSGKILPYRPPSRLLNAKPHFPSLAEIHYHQTNLKGHVCVAGNKSSVRVQPPSPETRYVHVDKIFTALSLFMMKFWYNALGLAKKTECFIRIQMFSKQGKVTFEFSFRNSV